MSIRRRAAALAGHTGDVHTARALLHDAEAAVRASALSALARLEVLTDADLLGALADDATVVRRRGAELAARLGGAAVGAALLVMVADDEPTVVETVCWALGERPEHAAGTVERVMAVAADHDDPLCREAAVAALGAIGDVRALPAILAALTDKPAVRRRAVIALAPFDGPEVDAALQQALRDRDWQVRQAAEDLLAD